MIIRWSVPVARVEFALFSFHFISFRCCSQMKLWRFEFKIDFFICFVLSSPGCEYLFSQCQSKKRGYELSGEHWMTSNILFAVLFRNRHRSMSAWIWLNNALRLNNKLATFVILFWMIWNVSNTSTLFRSGAEQHSIYTVIACTVYAHFCVIFRSYSNEYEYRS